MTDNPEPSAYVLDDLVSTNKRLSHDAALEIVAYLEELNEILWANIDKTGYDQGTWWWLLRHLNCESHHSHFIDVFCVAITGCFEAQCHALSLIHSQFPEITAEELRSAEELMQLVDQVTTCETEDRSLLRKELEGILERRRLGGVVERQRDAAIHPESD